MLSEAGTRSGVYNCGLETRVQLESDCHIPQSQPSIYRGDLPQALLDK